MVLVFLYSVNLIIYKYRKLFIFFNIKAKDSVFSTKKQQNLTFIIKPQH
ncbi:hypothetical protein AsAng_0041620 [Aureispira anguillae]|uniref:Uncharacterized protein n=1 Tax=Aureispira anguillae TaxID=2864201 RepID=A0A915YI12_9BACT|nr:hypothetical protein AsAng_0041620 [Aureispira anguillae]